MKKHYGRIGRYTIPYNNSTPAPTMTQSVMTTATRVIKPPATSYAAVPQRYPATPTPTPVKPIIGSSNVASNMLSYQQIYNPILTTPAKPPNFGGVLSNSYQQVQGGYNQITNGVTNAVVRTVAPPVNSAVMFLTGGKYRVAYRRRSLNVDLTGIRGRRSLNVDLKGIPMGKRQTKR